MAFSGVEIVNSLNQSIPLYNPIYSDSTTTWGDVENLVDGDSSTFFQINGSYLEYIFIPHLVFIMFV